MLSQYTRLGTLAIVRSLPLCRALLTLSRVLLDVEISFRTVRTTGNKPHRLEMRSSAGWSVSSYMELTFLRLM
jgi:hypothetical protein